MSQATNASGFSRRAFIGGAAAVGSIGIAAGLSGCSVFGGSGAGGGDGSGGASVALPDYVPITKGPKPDLAGTGNVQPVYYKQPADTELFKSVTGALAGAGTISAFTVSYNPPPPSNNSYLSYIEKKVNSKFDLQITPADSFEQKFATVVAGGSVPDVVEFPSYFTPPGQARLLEAQFADLSKYLSGSAVRDYPNLANIPTAAWVNTRVNGRIWGVPEPRPAFKSAMLIRADLVGAGENGVPKLASKSDFTSLCRDLTKPSSNRWALAGSGGSAYVDWGYDFFGAMFHVPNGWANRSGKFVSAYETDEWLEMASYIRSLRGNGYFQPDTPSLQSSQVKTLFSNGTVVMHVDSLTAVLDPTLPESTVIDAVRPFSASGGAVWTYQGASQFSFAAIKKQDDSRVRKILAVLNYLAAPFGSTEYRDLTYGEKGVHFTEQDGTYELTAAGTAQIGSTGLFRLAAGPQVLFSSVPIDNRLKRVHDWETAAQGALVKDASAGLYSEAATASSSSVNQFLGTTGDFILGRKSLSDVKSAQQQWTQSTGNSIRSQLESASGGKK
ncbi:extracellular solute-binding protein [Curtobacterium poinsettiae]|uniref:extracellular solute-binding protein n=1 Tax=Curtobacterium poinsettiae TaxID=159612 RepID=UPI00235FB471|nr:extracellular solute-binding protein [Curtobacterium flaccumfaciens]MDD1386788.1 extracellular solute-binding protein [Curtobacterium flaccumfaciens pv. poinsettiae]